MVDSFFSFDAYSSLFYLENSRVLGDGRGRVEVVWPSTTCSIHWPVVVVVVDTSLERWAVAQVPDWDGEAGLSWGSVAVRSEGATAANLECFE